MSVGIHSMTFSTTTNQVQRSPLTVAAGFVGAFIVASLAVQMVLSQKAANAPSTAATATTEVEPVVTSQAAMWSVLGER